MWYILFTIVTVMCAITSVVCCVLNFRMIRERRSVPPELGGNPNRPFQEKILKMCLERGLEDVQILPDRDGKISLYDMKQRSGFFHVVAEIVEPSSEKDEPLALEIMSKKISEYLSALEELNKETK